MTKTTFTRRSARALLVGAALVATLALDGALVSPAGAAPRPAVTARRPAAMPFRLTIGGREAVGQFKEASGFDSESEIVDRP